MSAFVEVLGWAFIFACSAACGVFAGMLVAARIDRFEDGPAPRLLHPSIPIVLFAVLGYALALRGGSVSQLGTVALLALPLAGAWYVDARKGIVPDIFTLVPLAIIGISIVVQHTWVVGVSTVFIFAVFATAAVLSKGRGMGWGDAKLAALTGAVLGLQSSLLALALACFAATIVSVIRDRGAKPIAFAPYMIVATLAAIAVSVHA